MSSFQAAIAAELPYLRRYARTLTGSQSAGDAAVRQAVRTIRGEVDRARERGDIDGHIWNLGHGVLPTTDAEAITRAVSIIHEEG